jgi:outer membrane lipoprotein
MDRRWCFVALAAVAACARPPTPLRGEFAAVTVADARAHPPVGERARWGGEIIRTAPGADRTCFEVVDHPLDRAARPRRTEESSGRFVACARGFYDPAVWQPGREMTAVGTVAGTTSSAVGEAEYRAPRLDAAAVYLWPVRRAAAYSGPTIGVGFGFGF